MNIFDIIVITLLLFGFFKGFSKGLFVEIASLIALLAGVYGSIHFSYFAEDFLKASLSWNQKYTTLLAYAVTFIAIVISITLIAKALTKIANFASLGMLNKILGGLFGAFKFGLVLSIFFIFFENINNFFPFVKKESMDKSILYHPVKKIAPALFPSLIKKSEDNTENVYTNNN
ncbi:MAG: CvpA family protein [Tenacibaculum sp.]